MLFHVVARFIQCSAPWSISNLGSLFFAAVIFNGFGFAVLWHISLSGIGDFFQRQLAMQLNYSRAFGGKDLKMYGLSCTPSVLQLRYRAEQKTASDDTAFYLGELKCLILGSDGVWDVSDPTNTVNLAARSLDTYHEGLSLVTEQRATQLPATPSEMVLTMGNFSRVQTACPSSHFYSYRSCMLLWKITLFMAQVIM
jgi:hypothetical protein